MTLVLPNQQFGAYRVISPLGRGGMAAVYRVYEAELDREVALKVLPAELMQQTGFLERFAREAKLIARLEHPNIVPVYASGVTDGTPWMALRLVSGGTLQDQLEGGSLSHEAGLLLFRQIAKALDHAHRHGVLHRDLKPQNVLVNADGEVYLADFGIARMMAGSTALTGTGSILGTPHYMAPEQAQGEVLGPACDIYAFAVIIYRWLCGQVPFDADTPLAVLMQHVQTPIPMAPMATISDGARQVLLKGLAKDPAARWETATALIDALQRVPDERTARSAVAAPAAAQLAQAKSTAVATVSSTRRGPKLVLALLATAAVAALGWGAYHWQLSGESATQRRLAEPVSTQLSAAEVSESNPDSTAQAPVQAVAEIDEPAQLSNPRSSPPPPDRAAEQERLQLAAAEQKARDEAKLKARDEAEQKAQDEAEQIAGVEAQQRAKQRIRQVQTELLRLDRSVAVDGKLDSDTQEAIRAFERAKDVAVAGLVTDDLIAQLKATSQWPDPPPGTRFRDCPNCPEMVVIAGGEFTMGSPADEPQRQLTEGPQRRVSVSAFALARTEVTFAHWDDCLAAGGCTLRPADQGWGRGERPVINVSWNDAQEYLAWLREQTDKDYRLPSEAQWEYAARAGTSGRVYSGDCISGIQANYNASIPASGCPGGEFRQRTVPVANFAANPFGLHDIHGNVWEWLQDCWNDSYRGAGDNDKPRLNGDCRNAVVRGGAWHDWGFWLRSASRYSFPRDSRHAYGGFRPARAVVQ